MWSTSRRKNLVGYERLAFTKYLVLESFLRYIVKILLKFCRFLESIVDFLVEILVRYNWGIFIVTVMVSISLLSGLILIIFLILWGVWKIHSCENKYCSYLRKKHRNSLFSASSYICGRNTVSTGQFFLSISRVLQKSWKCISYDSNIILWLLGSKNW